MPGPERHLAAILSADIAGYSRLMAEDEAATIEMVNARRRQVGLLLEEHRGRLVDFTGDNFLAEFSSAVDAVECAVEIQRVGVALNAALPPDRRMEFRVGIHLGEVQVQDDRLFGTGVNVASRLEGLAEPGGVCISAKVHEEVADRTQFGFRDLGEQAVKNIPRPVHAYAVGSPDAPVAIAPPRRQIGLIAAGVIGLVALAAAGWWAIQGGSGGPVTDRKAPTSLVVLPFDDLSPDGDQEYFAHGMSEELINALTGVPELDVKGRTTGAVVKGMGLDIPQIGEEIGVGAVIEGSVRKAGERLRITVQLIAVEDGFHLWSETYDRPLGDVFAVQEEVSRQIAESLQVSLRDPTKPLTGDLGAYDEYLLGRRLVERVEEDGIRSAVAHYRRALELDPDFAAAHAELAIAYGYLCTLGMDDCASKLASARKSAALAVSMDAGLYLAHLAVGEITEKSYQWEDAERAHRRAVELNPGAAEPHSRLGILLVRLGRVQEGLEEQEIAVGLDPYSPQLNSTASFAYTMLRKDLERAAELADVAARLAPEAPLIGVVRAAAYGAMGRPRDALEALLAPPLPESMKLEVRAGFEDSGLSGAWARLLELQVASSGRECTDYSTQAAIVSIEQLGDSDRAIRCLEEGYADRSLSPSIALKVSPVWDPLRNDPRFQAILEGMGLAD